MVRRYSPCGGILWEFRFEVSTFVVFFEAVFRVPAGLNPSY